MKKKLRLSAAIVATLTSCGIDPNGPHPQAWERFETAIRHRSTAPYFVLITVVDGRSEAAKSNCVPATFLLGAIHRELGLDYDDNGIRKGEEFALSAKDRRFVFTKPEALSNVRFAKLDGDEQSREACKIIRNGEPAFLADRSGRVVAGRHE